MTASQAARRACDSARSSSPLIHFESPAPVAMRPSRVWAYFSTTYGRSAAADRAEQVDGLGRRGHGPGQLLARRVAVAEPRSLSAGSRRCGRARPCAAARCPRPSTPAASQAPHLVRVVGQQPHRRDAQLRAAPPRPRCSCGRRRAARAEVGVDRVGARVLLDVGAQLVDQPDPAALVPGGVEHHAAALGGDPASASRSWIPQSQRSEVSASPVRHSECTRVGTRPSVDRSPRASARYTSPGRTSNGRDVELAELCRQHHPDGLMQQVRHGVHRLAELFEHRRPRGRMRRTGVRGQQQHHGTRKAGDQAQHAVHDGGRQPLGRAEARPRRTPRPSPLPRTPPTDVERQRHREQPEHQQRQQLAERRLRPGGPGGDDEQREVAGQRRPPTAPAARARCAGRAAPDSGLGAGRAQRGAGRGPRAGARTGQSTSAASATSTASSSARPSPGRRVPWRRQQRRPGREQHPQPEDDDRRLPVTRSIATTRTPRPTSPMLRP